LAHFDKKVKVLGVIHKKIFDAGFDGRTIKLLLATFDSKILFRVKETI